jgi:hypothetical protein
MADRKGRFATISRTTSALAVDVPADATLQDMNVVMEGIVGQIERLTGHPCLSGTHDVILRNQFEDVVEVQLKQR